jgi:hypothetical protein
LEAGIPTIRLKQPVFMFSAAFIIVTVITAVTLRDFLLPYNGTFSS